MTTTPRSTREIIETILESNGYTTVSYYRRLRDEEVLNLRSNIIYQVSPPKGPPDFLLTVFWGRSKKYEEHEKLPFVLIQLIANLREEIGNVDRAYLVVMSKDIDDFFFHRLSSYIPHDSVQVIRFHDFALRAASYRL